MSKMFDKFRGNKDHTEESGDCYITIERTEAFFEKADALSKHINSLNLPADQHNKLIELAIEQTLAAERGGFDFGLKMGIEIGKDFGSGIPAEMKDLFTLKDIKDIEK